MLTELAANWKSLCDFINIVGQQDDYTNLGQYDNEIYKSLKPSSFSFEVKPTIFSKLIHPLCEPLYNPSGLSGFLVSKTGIDFSITNGFLDSSLWIKSSSLSDFKFSADSSSAFYTINLQDVYCIMMKLVMHGVDAATIEKTVNQRGLNIRVGAYVLYKSFFVPVTSSHGFDSTVVGTRVPVPLSSLKTLSDDLLSDYTDEYWSRMPLIFLVPYHGHCKLVLESEMVLGAAYWATLVWGFNWMLHFSLLLPIETVTVAPLKYAANSILIELSLGQYGTLKFAAVCA